jgi:Ca2+-binding RTX toxin-like protein
MTGNAGVNRLRGAGGDDTLNGGGGADMLEGGIGNDHYVVDNVGVVIHELSGEGHDTVESSVNFSILSEFIEDLVLTGTGDIDGQGNGLDNAITGNSGVNKLSGGGGNDTLDGGAGGDRLHGGTGDDHYLVDDLDDRAIEFDGEGHDDVQSSVSYSLAGQFIEDLTLTGGAAINATGNTLDNALTGNGAANKLVGGLGNDTLTGGGGADSFYFHTALGATNVDTITDFEVGVDKIMLDRAVFHAIANGPLAGFAFYIGAAAHDANDRIVYDSATGKLYYDADGNGVGAAVHFATLDTGLSLQASDFIAYS